MKPKSMNISIDYFVENNPVKLEGEIYILKDNSVIGKAKNEEKTALLGYFINDQLNLIKIPKEKEFKSIIFWNTDKKNDSYKGQSYTSQIDSCTAHTVFLMIESTYKILKAGNVLHNNGATSLAQELKVNPPHFFRNEYKGKKDVSIKIN